MHILNHVTRLGAIAAGGLILYLAAETTLAHMGETTGPAANLVRALAAGLGVGAIAVGLAWHHGHRALALAIGLALMAGEGYGLVSTAERIVAQRERVQAEAASARTDRTTAAERVTRAERALADANAAAQAEAAKRHCAKECRTLLQGAITEAGLELVAARAALASIPAVPPSATALADRLGWAPWAVDVLQAVLASLAANGLGATLVAFGAHGSVGSAGAIHGRADRRASDRTGGHTASVAHPAIMVAGRDGPDVRPSGPSPRDVLQTSFATMSDDAERLAAFLDPDGSPDGAPRGPGRKAKRRTDGANVVAFQPRTIRPDVPANAPAAHASDAIARAPISEGVNRIGKRHEVLAALLADLDAGRTFGSQAEICETYGVPRSTLSDWLRAWEAEGISFRRATHGRVKHVARA